MKRISTDGKKKIIQDRGVSTRRKAQEISTKVGGKTGGAESYGRGRRPELRKKPRVQRGDRLIKNRVKVRGPVEKTNSIEKPLYLPESKKQILIAHPIWETIWR